METALSHKRQVVEYPDNTLQNKNDLQSTLNMNAFP